MTEPSLEYGWVYLRCLIIVGCTTYGLWYMILRKKPATLAVSFDDIDHKCTMADDSPPEKNSMKTENGGSTTPQTREETTIGGKESNEVTEYRSMSLKREYIKKGPFERCENDSMLTMPAYAKALAIMYKHVWIKFSINRKELIENRYTLYQDRQMTQYDKMISTQVTKYVREVDQIEEKALVFLAVEEKVFQKS